MADGRTDAACDITASPTVATLLDARHPQLRVCEPGKLCVCTRRKTLKKENTRKMKEYTSRASKPGRWLTTTLTLFLTPCLHRNQSTLLQTTYPLQTHAPLLQRAPRYVDKQWPALRLSERRVQATTPGVGQTRPKTKGAGRRTSLRCIHNHVVANKRTNEDGNSCCWADQRVCSNITCNMSDCARRCLALGCRGLRRGASPREQWYMMQHTKAPILATVESVRSAGAVFPSLPCSLSHTSTHTHPLSRALFQARSLFAPSSPTFALSLSPFLSPPPLLPLTSALALSLPLVPLTLTLPLSHTH